MQRKQNLGDPNYVPSLHVTLTLLMTPALTSCCQRISIGHTHGAPAAASRRTVPPFPPFRFFLPNHLLAPEAIHRFHLGFHTLTPHSSLSTCSQITTAFARVKKRAIWSISMGGLGLAQATGLSMSKTPHWCSSSSHKQQLPYGSVGTCRNKKPAIISPSFRQLEVFPPPYQLKLGGKHGHRLG